MGQYQLSKGNSSQTVGRKHEGMEPHIHMRKAFRLHVSKIIHKCSFEQVKKTYRHLSSSNKTKHLNKNDDYKLVCTTLQTRCENLI